MPASRLLPPTLTTLILPSRDKSWCLLSLFPLSALSFTLGYALRAGNAFDAYLYSPSSPTNLILYILSQVCIYIPPPLLELANYHILGRLLAYIPSCAPLPPRVVVRVFGWVMLVVETVNALGVSLSANPNAKEVMKALGRGMTFTALGLQLLVICAFGVLATVFWVRVRATGVGLSAVETALRTLYVSMGLILVRCVYRVVEHVGNGEVDLGDGDKLARLSPVMRYEAFFYVFEAVLMLVNVGVWNVWNWMRWFSREGGKMSPTAGLQMD
jgi:hypothetical protein